MINFFRKCTECGKRGAPIKIVDEYANTHNWYCKDCYESYGDQ